MPASHSSQASPTIRQSLGLDRHPLTRFKLAALSVAVLMVILGAALALNAPPVTAAGTEVAANPASDGSTGGSSPGLAGSGFAETRPAPSPPASSPSEPVAGTDDTASTGLHDLSPFMLKGGFGLFLGFSIGFAIRAFLRLAVIVAGFYLLLLVMMTYAGWVEVRWDLMGDQFSNLASSLGSQLTSLKAFLTGAIPASGLTLAGLAIGLRKK